MGHPYPSPLNVGRRGKRLALYEHVVEGVEVLVVDHFVVLVEADHPVSSLPGRPRATADLDPFVNDGLQVPRPRVRYLALSRAAMLAVTAGRFERAESLIAWAKTFGDEIEEPDADNVWFAQ